MSKSHDFDLSLSIPTGCPIIVQWREPLGAIQSSFELGLRTGKPDTAEAFASFAEHRAASYRRFMAKWLEAPIEYRLAVEYDELCADPRSILGDVLHLWGEHQPDQERLSAAINSVPHVTYKDRNRQFRDGVGVNAERRVEDFRYYDEALFDRIREIALGKAASPFRGRATRTGARRPVNAAAEDSAPRAVQQSAGVQDSAPAPQPPAKAPAQADAEDKPPQHQLRPGERVVFLHIPKCGGSSLSAMLASKFRKEEVLFRRDDILPTMGPAELRKYRYFTGHFSKYGIDAVPGPKRVVTVLREPRERILSLYYFWRSHRGDVAKRLNLKGPLLARELSLVDFLKSKSPEVVSSVNNFLVRVMLGPVQINASQGFRLDDREYCVETAITNLQRFNYVAFTDTLDHDVKEMMPLIGLGDVDSVERRNTFDNLTDNPAHFEPIEREEPNDEAWDCLRRLTFLDMAFYKRARDLKHTLRCPYPM
ncbi:MAG: hypothetical protein AAGJ94_14895 [Pseudomonadota bacterium]